MSIKERIGVIGVGNMGGAILEGLFKKEIAQPAQVVVCDKIKERAAGFAAQWKVKEVPSAGGVASEAEIILLAVKPQDLPAMDYELRSSLSQKHLLISILAGTPIARIRRVVGEQPAIVRAMPNLGAQVGEAVTALTSTNPDRLALAEKFFSGCGKTLILEETHFDLVTAVSGSGPAYFFLLMEMLAAFAKGKGLSQADAQSLAVQTAVGSGLLAQASSSSPEELRKMVTSKGGTTEAALKILEDKNFRGIFHEALEAALRRGRELSQ